MMYTAQTRPMTTFSDTFVDVDLTEGLKKQNTRALNRPYQQSITIENEPTISIWKAAETGNMNALTYFIHNHANSTNKSTIPLNLQEQDSEDDEDEDEDDDEEELSDEARIAEFVNTRDPSTECTLLHLIVSHNSNPFQPLKFLLGHGADATARNIYNIQAIHALLLTCKDPLECVQLLLAYDTDPNARDGDGWTPVHYAARFCHSPLPVLKALIEAGADINAIDTSGKTCLFGLLANGDHSLDLDYLISTAKANIKLKGDFLDNKTRRTRQGSLILQAAKYGRLSSLRILISSASSMESLGSILTRNELELAVDFVRLQLVKVNKRDQEEKLGLMIMILENLIQKLYFTSPSSSPLSLKKKFRFSIVDSKQQQQYNREMDISDCNTLVEETKEEMGSAIKRKPSLLKRMGNSIWKSASLS